MGDTVAEDDVGHNDLRVVDVDGAVGADGEGELGTVDGLDGAVGDVAREDDGAGDGVVGQDAGDILDASVGEGRFNGGEGGIVGDEDGEVGDGVNSLDEVGGGEGAQDRGHFDIRGCGQSGRGVTGDREDGVDLVDDDAVGGLDVLQWLVADKDIVTATLLTASTTLADLSSPLRMVAFSPFSTRPTFCPSVTLVRMLPSNDGTKRLGAKAGVSLKSDETKVPLRTWYARIAAMPWASLELTAELSGDASPARRASNAELVGARMVMLLSPPRVFTRSGRLARAVPKVLRSGWDAMRSVRLGACASTAET